MDKSTQAAIDAIGTFQATEDWKISPAEHSRSLPGVASPLARILTQPSLQRIINEFHEADEKAVKHQKTYKRFGSIAIALNAAAILTGALALFAQNTGSEIFKAFPSTENFGKWVALGQFLAIAGALVAAQIVIRMRPFDKWMRERAKAEIARIAIFEQVIDAQETSSETELPALPLQLEYFRRYQLETQIAYYSQRGAQHEQKATSRASRRDLYTAIASFAAAPVTFFAISFLGADVQNIGAGQIENWNKEILSAPLFNELLFFAGVIAGSLISMSNALSLLSQDRRNASRYLVTGDNLAYLSEEYLSRARDAAASGQQKAVKQFCDSVNEQISSEHREWISLNTESPKPDFQTIAASRMPLLK